MQRILDESRKRRDTDAPIESTPTGSSITKSSTETSKDGLLSLVESIKRKSQSSSTASGSKPDKQHKKKKQKTA